MNVVAQLRREAAALREKLAGIETAIAALGGSTKTGHRRRGMSKATRAKMSKAAKLRWAKAEKKSSGA